MSDNKREDVLDVRTKGGLFAKGNEMGKLGKGVPRPHDPKKKLQREAIKMAREMLNEAMPRMIETLIAKASSGEIQALNTALKVAVPNPKQETYLDPDVMAEAALLDPTSRTEFIHRKCLEGKISVEVAGELGQQASREAEAQVLRTMKLIARDMKNGMNPAKAYERLADLADGINEKFTPLVIDHPSSQGGDDE